ncbi:hypothetical protein [Bacillus sp. JJ722]|uniref:hypothetical protein n=1 Tax=Bacillus sp. JJ722 TaxID=3122973 RepID=UPI002FFF8731
MAEIGRTNPYVKTIWFDRIRDVIDGEIIQEGTRFNQARANNIEDGIYTAHDFIIELNNELTRLRVQLELDGRVPGNSGAFADFLDGTTNKLTLQEASADILEAVSIGATQIKVDSVVDFTQFTEVTVYDGTKHEDTLVTAVDTSAKTITVQALKNEYVKGAKVQRSSAKVDTLNKRMQIGDWSTFTVSMAEVN